MWPTILSHARIFLSAFLDHAPALVGAFALAGGVYLRGRRQRRMDLERHEEELLTERARLLREREAVPRPAAEDESPTPAVSGGRHPTMQAFIDAATLASRTAAESGAEAAILRALGPISTDLKKKIDSALLGESGKHPAIRALVDGVSHYFAERKKLDERWQRTRADRKQVREEEEALHEALGSLLAEVKGQLGMCDSAAQSCPPPAVEVEAVPPVAVP